MDRKKAKDDLVGAIRALFALPFGSIAPTSVISY
jgi:hypothetical protein